MDDYYIITFKNTHTAINSEKILKAEGFEVTVVPTPTALTKSCGISIRIKNEDFERLKKIIESKKIENGPVFIKSKSGYEPVALS